MTGGKFAKDFRARMFNILQKIFIPTIRLSGTNGKALKKFAHRIGCRVREKKGKK